MPVRRLEAEAVRDAMLAASGRLNPALFGPAVPVTPDESGQVIVGVDNRDGAGRPVGKLGLARHGRVPPQPLYPGPPQPAARPVGGVRRARDDAQLRRRASSTVAPQRS
ncbi:MAG: DUF1553 domain-containing protein [Isosphaeraceae bacterium]